MTLSDASAEIDPFDDEITVEHLRERAKALDIPGRSTMDGDALRVAIDERQRELASQRRQPAPIAADAVDGDDDSSGRPPLIEVAQTRAANRKPREITIAQEDR